MKSRKILSTALFVLTINSLLAQASLNNYSNQTSPYNSGWKYEIPYMATGFGLLSLGFILDHTNNVIPYTPEELEGLNRDDINSFDRGATYNWSVSLSNTSDILLLGAMVAPALFLAKKSTYDDFGWLALMGLEIFSINYGIKTTIKNLSNRARPYVYNTNVPMSERTSTHSMESFISGHVSTTAAMTFFVATVFTDYYPDMKTGYKIGVWSAAAIYPAVTAYIRVKSGNHFPTDVITAYAIGAFSGWFIPFLHKKKNKEDKFSFTPININGNLGIYLSYKF